MGFPELKARIWPKPSSWKWIVMFSSKIRFWQRVLSFLFKSNNCTMTLALRWCEPQVCARFRGSYLELVNDPLGSWLQIKEWAISSVNAKNKHLPIPSCLKPFISPTSSVMRPGRITAWGSDLDGLQLFLCSPAAVEDFCHLWSQNPNNFY